MTQSEAFEKTFLEEMEPERLRYTVQWKKDTGWEGKKLELAVLLHLLLLATFHRLEGPAKLYAKLADELASQEEQSALVLEMNSRV